MIASRFSELNDLMTASVGVVLGSGAILFWQAKTPGWRQADDRQLLRTLGWIGLGIIYAAFLFCFLCWPMDFNDDPQRIRKAWQGFFRVPMAALYGTSEYNAVTQMVRKLLLWGVLGAVLSQAVLRNSLPAGIRRLFLVVVFAFCAGFGAFVELVQLYYPSHTPDSTDIGLYALGSAAGIWVASGVSRQGSLRIPSS